MGGTPVGQWLYHAADGREQFWIVRFQTPTGKSYRPVIANGVGWKIGGMAKDRPLYRLPELAGAERIFVCEGEKAAEAARSIGLIATTSAHGPSRQKGPTSCTHRRKW